jgi:hypothetical protein
MIKKYKEESDFDYKVLRPSQDVFNVKHTDYYIVHGTGKKAIRKIFYGVTWNQYERDKLKEMYDELARQKIQLPPNWKENETVRMIYDQKGDIPKCVECLKRYADFLNEPKWHIYDPAYQDFFDSGALYVMGKDKQHRPIVVCSVYKLKLKGDAGDVIIRAIVYAMSAIKRNAFVQGYCENWIMIVEVNGAGLFNFPVSSLKKFIHVAQLYFSYCLEKLYVTNPSFMLNASWNMLKGLIEPDTVDKIEFLKKKDFYKLHANIDPSQLEKKYGGTHEDLTSFWPPTRFTSDPPYKTKED